MTEQVLGQRKALGQGRELGDACGPEGGTSSGQRGLDRIVRGDLRGVTEPAVGVAAQPSSAVELAQTGQRLGRPGATEGVVATEHPPVGAGCLRIREHSIEGQQVAVDVVEDRQHAGEATVAPVLELCGPTLTLRPPIEADVPALFALGSDPEVTRWFSWGPYRSEAEPRAWVQQSAREREAGRPCPWPSCATGSCWG